MPLTTASSHPMPPRHILVLEPADIPWMGLCQILTEINDGKKILHRIAEPGELGMALSRHNPQILMIGSVGTAIGIPRLLQEFALSGKRQNLLHTVAFIRQDLPYVPRLLNLFGIQHVISAEGISSGLRRVLAQHTFSCPRKSMPQFTPQERCVIQALLAGHNVSRVARLLGKNIRTISAQKQSIMQKLNMNHAGELQILGGRLMAAAL